ncbi:MAG: hypothetical protein B6I35_02865 [Anaerolineaceae bacterium 4572_32.2]|nr:MAG: hypothetical protein B6I35_02865 [Anaerolineaceae bacterium 4572_32.2]HEY72832.1 GAF domain-containing protein [Thermoflexia bacterium]
MPKPSKILIVDDDQEICNLLSQALSPLEYEITCVQDVSQALGQIKQDQFSVVLLDLMLPGPDGTDVLKHIHKQQTKPEVIMLTAHSSLETAVEALRLGAYDYLTKPFRINTVRSAVRRAVDKRRLETKLTTIYNLSHEIALAQNVDQAIQAVLDATSGVLEFESCGIWLIDQEKDELRRHAARGSEREATFRLPLSDEKGITVAVVRSGEPLYVPNVKDDPRYVAVRASTRSELAAPLKVKGRVIGVLNAESVELDGFDESDLKLLSTLAAQGAAAIENARLYEQAQQEIKERRQVEEEIKQHNAQLTALNEIGQAINATLDLQETLTLIADLSIQLLDVEATSVLLYDKADDDLQFAAASGLGANLVIGQRLAMGQGIAGWAAQHGEPALVPDVSKDPRVFKGFDRENVFAVRSSMCVPLRSKDQIIGVLEAVNKKGSDFDQDDLRLLSLLAAPATTAIENARLFEKVDAGREQLQALSRRLVDVQEAERGRVARELHDETGQALSSLLLSLSMLEQNAGDPVAVITRVNELESMVDRTLENLHRLSVNLRPASLDYLGLAPALEHYVELFDQRHSITSRFETIGLDDERLPPAVETAIYRIVQEAMTNVLRHAQATRVDVLLERRGDQIVTIIEDDGVGLDHVAATKSGRLGLLGMQERAEMLNGTLTIESSASAGTTVLVEIPGVIRNA